MKFYVSALVGVIIKVILQNARCNNKDSLPLASISHSEKCDVNRAVRTTIQDTSHYSRTERIFVHFDIDLCIHQYRRMFQIRPLVPLLILYNEPFDLTLSRKLPFHVKWAVRACRSIIRAKVRCL